MSETTYDAGYLDDGNSYAPDSSQGQGDYQEDAGSYDVSTSDANSTYIDDGSNYGTEAMNQSVDTSGEGPMEYDRAPASYEASYDTGLPDAGSPAQTGATTVPVDPGATDAGQPSSGDAGSATPYSAFNPDAIYDIPLPDGGTMHMPSELELLQQGVDLSHGGWQGDSISAARPEDPPAGEEQPHTPETDYSTDSASEFNQAAEMWPPPGDMVGD